MSIKKKILLSISAISVSVATGLAITPPAAAAPSTFYKTCRSSVMKGATLYSSCRTHSGDYRRSSLRLEGMHNNNGRLIYYPKWGRQSSFQRSCGRIKISKDVLSARCRNKNGRYVNARYRLENIHNRNGYLINR